MSEAENNRPYCHRPSAISGEIEYRISDQSLIRTQKDQRTETPFDQLRSLNLQIAPTRFQAERWVLNLKGDGGMSWQLSNSSYRRPGQFDYHGEAFLQFLDDLTLQLEGLGRCPTLTLGITVFEYTVYWSLIALVVVSAFLAGLYLLVTGLFVVLALKVAVIIYLLPRAIRSLQINKPKRVQDIVSFRNEFPELPAGVPLGQ